jgi:transposase InsO family protein
MRNLPGLHAAVRLAASSPLSPLVTSLDEYVVPGASHTTVTSHARLGRQLLAVQQVTARRAARDKTETDFAIHYIADLRPADGDTCRTGWLYLAIVLDLFNREIVGWSIKPRMTADIVTDALTMAWFRRRPEPGALHHSDRGSQYASDDFQRKLVQYGMRCSMSRKGNCWDNAPTESFFNSLKNERVHATRYRTHQEAMADLFEYIEVFYNRSRRHSSLGFVSPVQFLQNWMKAQQTKDAAA